MVEVGAAIPTADHARSLDQSEEPVGIRLSRVLDQFG
jgi:hypothetical protein